MLEQLEHLYSSYGKHSGTRIISWDTEGDPDSTLFLHQNKRAENTQHQFRMKSQ